VSRVALLKGGRSLERQISLRSGAQVQDSLERLGHEVTAIDVGPDLVDRLEAARADVAFVALHGRGGEDGTVQELLDVLGLPYTGSGPAACIRCMDKVIAKHALRDAGIPTPDFYAFSEAAFNDLGAARALPAIEARLEFPIVVKPAAGGSALGIKFAASAADVPGALDPLLVETNIVVLDTSDAATVVERCRQDGVLLGRLDARHARLVTHLDVGDADVERAATVLGTALKAAAMRVPRR